MRSLPPALVTAINSPQNGEVTLWLVEFTHPDLDTIRIVNNNEDITRNGVLYTRYSFDLKLIDERKNELQSGSMTLDNVDLSYAMDLILKAPPDKPVNVNAIWVGASAPNDGGIGPLSWLVKEAAGTADQITLKLGARNIRTSTFPIHKMTPDWMPALHDNGST